MGTQGAAADDDGFDESGFDEAGLGDTRPMDDEFRQAREAAE